MTVDINVRNVSNSEVTAFLSCKRMYNFAFVDNITPKVTPTPLARGSIGHEAFEFYILARLNGSNHEASYKAGQEVFLNAMRSGIYEVATVLQTKMLWERYMDFHKGWPQWRLLGTEQRIDLPLTETLSIAIRYDLYVEEIGSGKKRIGDFKYTYDFWQPQDHDLNGQMPKYVAVMRANGYQVDGGFLEEIRTRPLGKEKSADPKNLWKRTMYTPSRPRISNMLRQHVATSLEIEKHRALSPEEREEVSIPVLNKHGACKFCNFAGLCNSMIEGKKDLTLDIATDFTQNTYGYNQQVMEDLL